MNTTTDQPIKFISKKGLRVLGKEPDGNGLVSTKVAKPLSLTKVEVLSKKSSEPDQFRPTSSMKIWVATSVQLKTENISTIAKECGLDRKNWYVWIKRPGFLEWYAEELDRLRVIMRQRLDNIGLKMAEKDFRYFEVMQKVLGRDLSDKEPEQPGSRVQINFNANKYIKNRE